MYADVVCVDRARGACKQLQDHLPGELAVQIVEK